MNALDKYKFQVIKEQSRPIGIRLTEILNKVAVKYGQNIISLKYDPPQHTNGEWKIEATLAESDHIAAFIKGDDLRQCTDQEIYDFIIRGIEDAR